MALTYHPDVQVRANTTWTLNGLLYDANGNLMDVTNCQLVWVLLDPDGNPVVPVNSNVTITKTDPVNGQISITVAKAATAVLNPGRYTDGLEVSEGSITGLFWRGQILVAANPFGGG